VRYLLVLFLASLLGCASQGNACIQPGQFTGDTIKSNETGKVGKVTRVYGTSSRCSVASHPVLADVDFK
jgi:hypothetical protein